MFKTVAPFLAFSFILLFVCFHPLKEHQFGASSDEGYYRMYASTIVDRGMAGFQGLVDWLFYDVEAKVHPTPSRVGYVLSLALLFKLFGESFAAIALLSMVTFLLFVAVNYVNLRKYYDRVVAFCMVVILTSSPLLLGMSRRALVDMPVFLFWALAFWAFVQFSESRSRRDLWFFVFWLVLGILFKEVTLFLFPVFLGMALVLNRDRSSGKKVRLFDVFFAELMAGVLSLIVLAWCLGGEQRIAQVIVALRTTHAQGFNPYALFYGGPWQRYLVDFMFLSPLVVLLAGAYVFYAFVMRKMSVLEKMMALFGIGVYIMFSLMPFGKVVRYVGILEIVLAVFAVRAMEEFAKRKGAASARAWGSTVGVLTVLLATLNFLTFYKVFYLAGLLDPITRHLAVILGFMPG